MVVSLIAGRQCWPAADNLADLRTIWDGGGGAVPSLAQKSHCGEIVFPSDV
jgi:hypothetical protein